MLACRPHGSDNTPMAQVSAEDFIDWATPDPRRYTGYATSQEQHDDVVAFVQSERRQFLLESFRERIAELSTDSMLQTDTEPVAAMGLSDVPAEAMLNYEQHMDLVENGELSTYWRSRADMLRMWRIIASFQPVISGYTSLSLKYSVGMYGYSGYSDDSKERDFAFDYERSKAITDTGFPVRVNMNGVGYIQQGSIDLDSVQKWVDTRELADYPTIYETPQRFWPDVIRMWHEDHPDLSSTTFADIADELADGAFVAPYFPDALICSDQFITLDNCVAILGRRGDSTTIAKKVFKALLAASTDDPTTQRQLLRSPNSGAQATYAASGVSFMATSVLSHAFETLKEQDYETPRVQKAAQFVLDHYVTKEPESDNDWYDELVFGD